MKSAKFGGFGFLNEWVNLIMVDLLFFRKETDLYLLEFLRTYKKSGGGNDVKETHKRDQFFYNRRDVSRTTTVFRSKRNIRFSVTKDLNSRIFTVSHLHGYRVYWYEAMI